MESSARFSIGAMEVTQAAAAALARMGETPGAYVSRHQAGDWGHVDPAGREANEFGARYGHEVVSRYRLADATGIRVETSPDHTMPRVLLAAEYVPTCPVSVQEG